MARFLLIHGSWHGAWCWHKVIPRLGAHGPVTAVNLPGRGRDFATPASIDLDALVAAAARHLPEGETTTVVVHSRYGIVASALAERHPDRIRRIVYLASFMLRAGECVAQWSAADRQSLVPRHLEVNPTEGWDWLRPEGHVETLYADCMAEDVALADALLCREPSRPAAARLDLSEERYGRVPRAYIRLTQDQAVSLALQDRLIQASPPDRVESLDASLSAYFSQPDRLTETILGIDRD